MTVRFPALFALVFAAAFAFAWPAFAQDISVGNLDAAKVEPSLVADTAAVQAGKPFTVAVRLKMAAGWHVYWRFGGDAGAPPQVEWELPAGFKAGEAQWPIPTAHTDPGDLLTYIHEGELALLYEITPPAELPAGEVTLKASINWLVCAEICIPGKGGATLALPAGGDAAAANTELFEKWRAQLPREGAPPFPVSWDRQAGAFSVKLTGVPKDAKVEFFPLPPGFETKPSKPEITASADGTGRTIKVPIEDAAGKPDTAWSGLLVTRQGGGARTGWMISPGGSTPAETGAAGSPAAKAPLGFGALLAALGSAFLGGLLLNLMPCVLPVIGLKIYGFIGQAGEEPRRVFHLGLAFCAGILTFFFTLAVLVVGFAMAGHTLNYGTQFTNPYVLTGVLAVVFVFALSLLGVFEIGLGGETTTALAKLSQKEGLGGAFTHGLVTTLLGTACIGPFLGSILGIALLRPGIVTFLVLGAMGVGMALPYVILTAKPAWMKFLPKPGLWMERLKQLMGFLMLAIAVVLLWVLGLGRNSNVVVLACAFLLVLSLAAWIRGSWPQRSWSWIAALALAALGWISLVHGQLDGKRIAAAAEANGPWKPFAPETLAAAIARGQPVFIDFTADWCINCKANEFAVLNTDAVQAEFEKKDVLLLKADWTDGNPLITEWLHKFDRVGVPVYVIYNGRDEEPDVLPEILTKKTVLDRLHAIGS